MSLTPGSRLGAYEVVSQIGAGGMGVVYQARDTVLHRDVALKVLPESLAGDPDRLMRFEREAQALAALNHPNIAQIYGIEHFEPTRTEGDGPPPGNEEARPPRQALVLEYVAGPTLADRINAGPIPLDEALPIARQIAEGLEAAHERGILHRDLKPANIKVRDDGTVKLLDFGLAKALAPDPASPEAAELANSPTLTARATEMGIVLGTAAYMAPEQAKGKAVDKRVDVWAFGCVLFEMLTGERAFAGETVPETLARVLEREPRWQALAADTPQALVGLLRRCLARDSGRRLHDIADARIEIEEIRVGLSEGAAAGRQSSRRRRRIPVTAVGLAGALLGALAVWFLVRPPPTEPAPVTRFTISLPEGHLLGKPDHPLAISPDGTTLAYVVEVDGQRQLYVHDLSELQGRPLAGTEDASNPFFSSDGRWVGFFADGRLKKVEISGARVGDLCEVPSWLCGGWSAGALWGLDGRIIFAQGTPGGVARISDEGGVTEILVKAEEPTRFAWWPQQLPDRRGLLLTFTEGGKSELVALAPESGARHTILREVRGPLQAAILDPDRLVYTEGGRIFAAPFDMADYEMGTPVSVLDGVRTEPVFAGPIALFALSASGTLAYVPQDTESDQELVWVNRDGHTSPSNVPPGVFYSHHVNLSPDGDRAVVQVLTREGWNIWVFDMKRGTGTPLTSQDNNQNPIWTPDGRWITYNSPSGLCRVRADGSGEPEELGRDGARFPSSWSPDGSVLAYFTMGMDGENIYAEATDGTQAQQWALANEFDEYRPMFSPDGNWIAYVSERTGRPEVFVQAYPEPGPIHPISTAGGTLPRWSGDGRELFYRSGRRMVAVNIETEPEFKAELPRTLFETDFEWDGFDVSSDGQRFLIMRGPEGRTRSEIRVILNWAEEVKRLVPTGR